MTTRRALWVLIVVTGLIRLGWAASLGPGNDEAYHYLFTVHPDWSYFDHPPMVAWVESAGLALAGGGGRASAFGLRLGFVALFAGSTWLLARLTGRFYGGRAGFFAALALNLSAYHTAAAGAFALPDGPLLFFWLLTLDRLAVAALAPPSNRVGAWALVGLAWGGALLSKYHGIFLPAGALVYIVWNPSARGWLRRPGPYVAAALGVLTFSPVLGWNASHGWASFLFQGGRALGEARLRPDTFLAALALPALYLFPWVWFWLVKPMAQGGRRAWQGTLCDPERFLLAESFVPLGVFLAVSTTRPVLPHWTLVGFVALFPLLGRDWALLSEVNPTRVRRRALLMSAAPLGVMAAMLYQAHTGILQEGRAGGFGVLNPSRDPTADMYGWDEVANELKRRGLVDRPGTFLFTPSWYHSGQLGFAVRDTSTPVLCYHPWDARGFAFWSRPDEWLGRDGILVISNASTESPERYAPYFTRMEHVGSFDVKRHGAALRRVSLYRCVRQTLAFPFDDLGRTLSAAARGEKRLANGNQKPVRH